MLLNLLDYEAEAKKHLDEMTLAYYSSGADAEITLKANQDAWSDVYLRPKHFVNAAQIDSSTSVLGHSISFPVMVPPMAFQQLAHPNGEAEMARATGDAGTIYCLSTISNIPMERVIESTAGPVWFQLYVDRDRQRALKLVQKAQEAGAKALIVTVDTPLLGNRERDVRLGFKMPNHLRLPNLPQDGHALRQATTDPSSALANFAKNSLDPSLTWADLARFAEQTTLPVIAKGIMRADDAKRAIDHGAKAIIVSNHGGRQLDTAIPTAWALPEIVDAVGKQAEVYVDGGIRRGTDVMKALSLGARAVLVGRPMLWGLSIDGYDGCKRVLSILKNELLRAMALAGAPTVEECSPDLIWKK